MAKEKKFVTFAQQRHQEYLYNVFTIVFVVGVFLGITQALFSYPADWIFGKFPQSPIGSFLKIFLQSVYTGVGVYLPFLIYQIIVNKTSGRYFTRKNASSRPIDYVLAIPAVAGIGLFVQYISSQIAAGLRDSGFHLRETLPDIGNSLPDSIFFILCTALIPAFFWEMSFRGIVINNLKKDSHAAAVIVAAILGSFTFTSIQQTPYLLITGLLLGWLYLKTKDIFLTYACSAVTNGLLATKWVLTCTIGRPFLQLQSTICLLAGLIGLIFLVVLMIRKKFKTTHETTDKPLSRKDIVLALLKSFGLWLFIGISVFRMFFGYIAKPTQEYQSPYDTQNSQQTTQSE